MHIFQIQVFQSKSFPAKKTIILPINVYNCNIPFLQKDATNVKNHFYRDKESFCSYSVISEIYAKNQFSVYFLAWFNLPLYNFSCTLQFETTSFAICVKV
jgi:hypothetical protein